MATRTLQLKPARAPILALLHPREQVGLVVGALACGLLLGWAGMRWLGWPLWGATATVLALLLFSGVAKWRADARRYGPTVMWNIGETLLLVAAADRYLRVVLGQPQRDITP